MTAAGSSVTYSSDAQNRRKSKTVSGATTQYFYSGGTLLARKEGSVWRDYIFFGGKRVAWIESLTSGALLHSDHLGSIRVSTFAGNVTGTCEYEPFGETQAGSSCSLPSDHRFAGMEWDSETGLYHTWFRQYDEKQGRWSSVDPISGSIANPQSLDRYAYVTNDPVNRIDPSGLQGKDWWHVLFSAETPGSFFRGGGGAIMDWINGYRLRGDQDEIVQALAEHERRINAAFVENYITNNGLSLSQAQQFAELFDFQLTVDWAAKFYTRDEQGNIGELRKQPTGSYR